MCVYGVCRPNISECFVGFGMSFNCDALKLKTCDKDKKLLFSSRLHHNSKDLNMPRHLQPVSNTLHLQHHCDLVKVP